MPTGVGLKLNDDVFMQTRQPKLASGDRYCGCTPEIKAEAGAKAFVDALPDIGATAKNIIFNLLKASTAYDYVKLRREVTTEDDDGPVYQIERETYDVTDETVDSLLESLIQIEV